MSASDDPTLGWRPSPGDLVPGRPSFQLERRLGYILHTERTHSNAAQAFMGLLDEAG